MLRPRPTQLRSFQLPGLGNRYKSKSSKEWLSRQARDPFVKQRNQAEGNFRARSAFKLIEMNDRFGFLNGVKVVVDLGGAPGGWSQVVAKQLGGSWTSPAGAELDEFASLSPTATGKRVIAVDLLPITPIPGVTTIKGDFLSSDTRSKLVALLQTSAVDVVLSDMAPNMSGNRLRDIDQSLELCTSALEFARDWLVSPRETGKPHSGCLVLKYFEHPELQAFRKEQLQPSFRFISNVKPPSSRSESSEAYWVCSGFRGTQNTSLQL